MRTDKEKVITLLKVIHEFYPVGIPTMKMAYPGYSNYNRILTEKINSIMDNRATPWVNVVENLKAKFGTAVTDMNYLQFPCHLMKIELETESNGPYDFKRFMVVNISLLCDFYTIFIEDFFRYASYTNQIAKPSTSILFSSKTGEEKYFDGLINNVKEKVSLAFPTHERISHKPLFSYKVRGANPYTEEESDNEMFCLYQLLFDGFYKTDNLFTLD